MSEPLPLTLLTRQVLLEGTCADAYKGCSTSEGALHPPLVIVPGTMMVGQSSMPMEGTSRAIFPLHGLAQAPQSSPVRGTVGFAAGGNFKQKCAKFRLAIDRRFRVPNWHDCSGELIGVI